MKIFKYLGKYWYAILAVLALLVVQARSDLTLPSITSDIVDVGIQQGGLENPAPEKIRKSTMQAVEMFMTDDEKQTITDNYKETTIKVDGKDVDIYEMNLKDGMTKNKLAKVFELPMLMLASSQQKGSDNHKTSQAETVLEDYKKWAPMVKKPKNLVQKLKI